MPRTKPSTPLSVDFEPTAARLCKEIVSIIEAVDQRCMAADGPVTPTLREMTQEEMSRIYRLAKQGSRSSAEAKKEKERR